MRGSRATQILGASVAPALLASAACSFVLDFDELQGGTESAAGASGQGGAGVSGSAGAAGVSGSAGGSPCGVCDDGNPCTDDSCDSEADPPACRFTPAGLRSDGFSITEELDELSRVTLAALGDRFFLSTLDMPKDSRDVTLRSFPRTGGDGFTQIVRYSEVAGDEPAVPVSAGALLPLVVGFDTRIHSAVALQGSPAAQAYVFDLVFDQDLQLISEETTAGSLADVYRADDLRALPVSWTSPVSKRSYLAWRGNAGVYVVGLGSTLGLFATPTFPGAGFAHLAPLATASRAGLLSVGARGVEAHFFDDPPLDPIAISAAGAAIPIQLCEPGFEGEFTSVGSVDTGLPGLYFAHHTRLGPGGAVTELFGIACAENPVSGVTECSALSGCDQASERVLYGAANPAIQLVRRQSDPASVLHVFTAVPFNGDGELGLSLAMQRSDTDAEDGESVALGVVDLVRRPGTPADRGPDFPSMAIAGENKLAIAWIEPRGTADLLRVERFDVCYADP